MIKFLPILADKFNGKFENHQYLPFILNLFSKYKNILIDDYYPKDHLALISYLIDEINQLYPWFLLCLVNDTPIGVVWISHWHGMDIYSEEEEKKPYHSCQIHSYIDKKYWGKTTRNAMNELLNILFNEIGVRRIQMEIPEFNHKACAFAKRMGFVQEGIIRCATMKDSKPVNHILFSKLKEDLS